MTQPKVELRIIGFLPQSTWQSSVMLSIYSVRALQLQQHVLRDVLILYYCMNWGEKESLVQMKIHPEGALIVK